ncbi:MAG: serine--tRNA ligase [Hyphomicrobiaceae bacterium]
MFDIKWIRDNPEAFDAGLKRRNIAPGGDILFSSGLIALDEARRGVITRLQEAQARRNAASKEIGKAKAAKDEATAAKLMAEVASLKDVLGRGEEEQKGADTALDAALSVIPNIPLPNVPAGKDEHDNKEIRKVGTPPALAGINKPLQHFEIGERLGLMDFETAARLSGARFVVLKGQLARMERALGAFMLDLHTGTYTNADGKALGGYTEIAPPMMVRDAVMYGTAQLPKFENDQFEVVAGDGQRGADRRWLIPTAEVPLTNLVRESILDEAELPIRVTAFTPCFRAEAGAAGKDTRGMIRQHQFSKVELVSITTPEKSLEEHERMTACAEEVLKRLGLAYRVVLLCTGDMGFASQKTYDIEVWLPGQNTYREISSCSVCGDFQARRMDARYRAKGGKPEFVHTLNGSGLAVGRTLIAILENYQNADGSVTIPEALVPYMGGLTRLEKQA